MQQGAYALGRWLAGRLIAVVDSSSAKREDPHLVKTSSTGDDHRWFAAEERRSR
jgi:hypothetical protein